MKKIYRRIDSNQNEDGTARIPLSPQQQLILNSIPYSDINEVDLADKVHNHKDWDSVQPAQRVIASFRKLFVGYGLIEFRMEFLEPKKAKPAPKKKRIFGL